MNLLNYLSLSNEKIIKVLSFSLSGLGKDVEKDSLLAYWPCHIVWTDISTDEHVALLDESLTKKDDVFVISCSKNDIRKGYYRVTRDSTVGTWILEEAIFQEK